MREKLKPFKILIIGILVITAFVRGISMYIAFAVFFGVYLVYLVVKPILKKRKPKEMNQSVISRMQLIFDVDEPDTETIIERVMKITKCGDKSAVRRMAETIREISEKCRETMISDGCCGIRELIAWVQSYMITGSIAESSKYTVLPSVSNSRENREEIYSTCFEPKYAA